MAVYGLLISDPAVWWDTPAAALIMKAMGGKGCRIVFVPCAHTLTGEGCCFVDMAMKRISSRNSVRTPVLSVLQ